MSDENQLVKRDEGTIVFKGADQSEGELGAQSDGSEEREKGNQFYNEKNYPEALKLYKLAADLGSTLAMRDLGYMYKHGKGIEKSFKSAHYYYSKASAKGDTYGEYNLGLLYENWEGPERDLPASIYHYTQSADQGHKYAAFYLGLMHKDGKGTKQDYAKAIYYLEKSDDQGDAYSAYWLGTIYQNGEGVKDYAKAAYYFDRAIILGISIPVIPLPELYYVGGYGLEKNKEKALHYTDIALETWVKWTGEVISEAAKQLFSKLIKLLIYIAGDFKDDGNYEEALKLCNRVLAFKNVQQSDKCYALTKGGEIYFAAHNIEKNFDRALRHFELGSDTTECGGGLGADSLGWLGRMYFVGRGVPKDTKKALELLDNASKLESEVALKTLCGIYANGYGVEKDFKKAIPYCKQVKTTNIDAGLGYLYYSSGQYEKALPYLKKSADTVNGQNAANLISLIYINGVGIEKDFDTAREWAKKAGKWEQSLISLIEMDRTHILAEMQKYPDAIDWTSNNFKTWKMNGLIGLTTEEEESIFDQS